MAAAITADELPLDVLEVIFARLPLDDLHRCAVVCKRWQSVYAASTRLAFPFGYHYTSHTDDSVFVPKTKEIKLTAPIPSLSIALLSTEPDHVLVTMAKADIP